MAPGYLRGQAASEHLDGFGVFLEVVQREGGVVAEQPFQAEKEAAFGRGDGFKGRGWRAHRGQSVGGHEERDTPALQRAARGGQGGEGWCAWK